MDFSVIHGYVGEAACQAPDKGAFGLFFVVAQLEPGDGPILVQPDNQVEVVRVKPAPFPVPWNLSYLDKLLHCCSPCALVLDVSGLAIVLAGVRRCLHSNRLMRAGLPATV